MTGKLLKNYISTPPLGDAEEEARAARKLFNEASERLRKAEGSGAAEHPPSKQNALRRG